MKVLVIDRYPDLAEEFQAMCAESDLEALRLRMQRIPMYIG